MRALWAWALALLAGTLPMAGADWRDSLDRKAGSFPALRALTTHYDFGWSGIKAAEADVKFSTAGGKSRLELNAKTVGAPRKLWRMDMRGVSTVNARTLQPIKLEQTESYSRKSFEITADFSADGVERLKVPTPRDKSPAKPKRFKFSPVHDLHSALLFIRSQPLRKGDVVRLCVYPSTAPYFAEVEMAGPEKVEAAGRKWDAIKCEIRLREVAKDLSLTKHEKFKNATAWISDDADRLLLRIECEVFIGSVWAEMKSVEFAKEPSRGKGQ